MHVIRICIKITPLTVGKPTRDWVRQGLDIYISRLKHYIPFTLTEIPELKNVSSFTEAQIKTKEGELILKNIRPSDELVLLDERGRQYTSVELAKVIQDRITYSGRDMVFVIGGAYGFSQAVYDFLTSDGTGHLCRTAVQSIHNNTGRTVSP